MLSFFPRGVLDEILNLIESVSEVFFFLLLYATHRQDLFYITVKYHDNIPKGFQVKERTRNRI